MRCQIATIAQMGEAVKGLLKYTELKVKLSEESSYYLRLVLNELITNSFKHSGSGNTVRVEVGVNDSMLEISVEDGGKGIADRSRLGQCSNSSSESGRGLAIVMGVCSSVELNAEGNRVTARLSVH
jgi:anti-sigma regulatory factor (Ser/Thr protein kinase)